LHQADGAGLRLRTGLELRFLVDHGREQRWIQVIVACVAADDRLVAKRVPEPLPPAGLGGLQDGERPEQRARKDDEAEQPFHAVSRAMTSATKASSSSSVPSLT